jgi:hypothetical protein
MQMVEIIRIWDRIADLVIKSILSGILYHMGTWLVL